jgi:uncharacterized protein YdeI (YjbR/CyaY-like superfamily)
VTQDFEDLLDFLVASEDGRHLVLAREQVEVRREVLQERRQLEALLEALFAELDSRNRYAILYRVDEAKKPETRARRIEKFVAMLAAGDTIFADARKQLAPGSKVRGIAESR